MFLCSSSYEIQIKSLKDRSTILKNGQVVSTSRNLILADSAQYNSFWVSWETGVISAGRGQPFTDMFLNYTDNSPVDVSSVGLASYDALSEVHWEITQDQGMYMYGYSVFCNHLLLNWQLHNES